MTNDAIVVGAGVAGLACARELAGAGLRVVVLERSKGVGGRCATRRIEGGPIDHGVVFLHGSDPGFLEALDGVDETERIESWPVRVHGTGVPCQPDAFSRSERRMAFAGGVNLFPKHLARGLDVRREWEVVSLQAEAGLVRARSEAGEELPARAIVLALALEQSARVLDTVPVPPEGLLAARRLLRMVGTVPCLTVLAGYSPDCPEPGWDVSYPEGSRILLMVSNESSKRRDGPGRALVLQAHPRWSRQRLDEPPETWTGAMLDEGARLLGPWARRPAWVQSHRWRHARTERGGGLSAPILVTLPGGARIGLTGEGFSVGGGVEGAWLAGRAMARRLLAGGAR